MAFSLDYRNYKERTQRADQVCAEFVTVAKNKKKGNLLNDNESRYWRKLMIDQVYVDLFFE